MRESVRVWVENGTRINIESPPGVGFYVVSVAGPKEPDDGEAVWLDPWSLKPLPAGRDSKKILSADGVLECLRRAQAIES